MSKQGAIKRMVIEDIASMCRITMAQATLKYESLSPKKKVALCNRLDKKLNGAKHRTYDYVDTKTLKVKSYGWWIR